MNQTETKKTVHTFAAASFLNDFGSDMIYPIWPTFVKDVLLANMLTLGFIDGLGDAIVSISQAASGYLSDRTRKRKIFVWTGYLFGSASRIGYAASTAWQHLIPFRILDRAGKMRGAPRDAIIADASTNANRGRNFGLLRAMDNLGAVCGIITCLLLFGLLGYQTLFLIAAVPSAIGALMILAIIKEKKPSESKIYRGMSLRELDTNLKLFITLSAIFAFGSFSYSFLLLFAKNSGFKVEAVPILYLLFTAVASLFSLPFGKLSDVVGRKNVLLLSYGLWGLVSVVFILSQNLLAIILSFFLYGLHRGALETVQKAFVAELAPTEYRASALGGFQMVVGLCALPSSLLAGLLWETYNMFTPFYLSLVLTTISAMMLLLVKEKQA
ncbi:MFS transporter [Candidatus Bathyarchaeota archaeon]|nr:MFS transporter [Candidatus Bathyarchaeota archaeon]